MHIHGRRVMAVLQVLVLHVHVALCALHPSPFRRHDYGAGQQQNSAPNAHPNNHLPHLRDSLVDSRDMDSGSGNSRRQTGDISSSSSSSSGSAAAAIPEASSRPRAHFKSRNRDAPHPSNQDASRREHRWATAAYNFVHSLDCDDVFFTTGKECRALVAVPRHSMNVLVALPSPYGRFRTAIPQEPLVGSGLHDAVLVVDPYPGASFGHLVIVFFLDSGMSRGHCQRMGGVYLDEDECLHLALRRRCRNALERLARRRNYARRCEINFLPVVHLASSGNQNHQHPSSSSSGNHQPRASSSSRNMNRNHLECRSELAGFGKCPTLPAASESARSLVCDHLRDNTRRCSTTQDSGVRTSCRIFEACDQAVLLAGGWNRHTGSGPRHLDNLRTMFSMLRRNGFKRRNIKVFFANGAPPLRVTGEPDQKVFPAALKLALRNHLRRMCLTPHCVDSLFLYLNSPAASDGSALLWDLDGDGLATAQERYTVQELKEDLASCEARQVTLVVDQSFSGELVHAFRRSPAHRNLVVFSSGKSGEYSFQDEFSRFWASWNHTQACAGDTLTASRAAVRHSSPRMGEGEEGYLHSTIFGAPCDVRPPFTQRELRHNYFGCQNLPTAVWLRQILRASSSSNPALGLSDDDDDDDDDEDEEEEEDGDDDGDFLN